MVFFLVKLGPAHSQLPVHKKYTTPAPYMLNTRNEEKNTVFYSYVACFVNTFTLTMNVSVSYTGFNQAVYGIHSFVIAPQEYVNIYSTRRTRTPTTNLTYESTLGLPTEHVCCEQ